MNHTTALALIALMALVALPGCTGLQHTADTSGEGRRIGVEVEGRGGASYYQGLPPQGSRTRTGDAPPGDRAIYPSVAPAPVRGDDRGEYLYEWRGGERTVSRVEISLSEQKAIFYSGDDAIGWAMVATGKSGTPTPAGEFKVLEKSANKRSNLYGRIYGPGKEILNTDARAGRDRVPDGAEFEGSLMPYYMRLTADGVGMHAGYIPTPGTPASHGCIRLPLGLAPILFQHVPVGTPVKIS